MESHEKIIIGSKAMLRSIKLSHVVFFTYHTWQLRLPFAWAVALIIEKLLKKKQLVFQNVVELIVRQ